jgi:formylmethanofuran dehydrogenase subunit A
MTLVKLSGGRIFDPANKRRGEAADLYIRDGRISTAPGADVRIDQSFDLAGKIVMPGGIDIHSHVAGGR